MAVYLGKDVNKLKGKGGKWKYLSEKEMLETSAKFAPYRFVTLRCFSGMSSTDESCYRSLFMWYMWRIEDVDIDALQNK